MPLVRHTDPDDFIAAAGPALDGDAATASILRAISLQAKRRAAGVDERVYLATVREGAHAAAAVQRGEYALVAAATDAALAARFADDIAAEHPSLQGVSGALDVCESFAQRWRERTERAHLLRAHLRQFVLTEVAQVPDAPGAMRIAGDADLEWLTDAVLAFVVEAGVPDAPPEVRRRVAQTVAQGRYRVWDDGFRRVALAGWSDAGAGEARVGPVYTPRDARRRGYATALTATLSRELLAEGRARIFLTADVANPTSNAIYGRIGYRPVSDYFHFDFVPAPPARAAA